MRRPGAFCVGFKHIGRFCPICNPPFTYSLLLRGAVFLIFHATQSQRLVSGFGEPSPPPEVMTMSNYDPRANARWGQSAGPATGYASQAQVDQGLRAYMLGVYNYMTVGLAITGVFALGLKMVGTVESDTGRMMLTPIGQVLYKGPMHWVIMLAPLAFVLFFSFRIDRMSAASARNLFFAFSAVMGLSLSTILLVYTGNSVARAFFITAGAFGGLSLYGYTTKRDLSPIGSFLVMGLIGLILASVVNIFLQSSAFQFGLSVLSILIFAGPHRLGHAGDQGNVLRQ